MLSIFEVWFHPQNDKQVNKFPRRSRKGTLGGPVTLQTKVLPFDSTDPWASPDPQRDIDKDPPVSWSPFPSPPLAISTQVQLSAPT